jgi:hypothetical protein
MHVPDIRSLRAPASGGGFVTPAQWNALIEHLSRTMIVGAAGSASVHGATNRTIWVGGGRGGSASVAYPFQPRAVVAADFDDGLPEGSEFYIAVGSGLVNSVIAPGNANTPIELDPEETYYGYLHAEIDTDKSILDLTIGFATSGDGIPVSPEGDAGTGAPPTDAYHCFMQITTTATGIDWTTLIHAQRDFTLAYMVIPDTLTCDTIQLATVWL